MRQADPIWYIPLVLILVCAAFAGLFAWRNSKRRKRLQKAGEDIFPGALSRPIPLFTLFGLSFVSSIQVDFDDYELRIDDQRVRRHQFPLVPTEFEFFFVPCKCPFRLTLVAEAHIKLRLLREISVGDEELDAKFNIRTDNERAAVEMLRDERIRELLLELGADGRFGYIVLYSRSSLLRIVDCSRGEPGIMLLRYASLDDRHQEIEKLRRCGEILGELKKKLSAKW